MEGPDNLFRESLWRVCALTSAHSWHLRNQRRAILGRRPRRIRRRTGQAATLETHRLSYRFYFLPTRQIAADFDEGVNMYGIHYLRRLLARRHYETITSHTLRINRAPSEPYTQSS